MERRGETEKEAEMTGNDSRWKEVTDEKMIVASEQILAWK